MKLSKLLFLFILAAVTISCSSDDDNPPAYTLSNENFVDTYKLKFLELREVETVTFSNGSTSTSSATTVGSVFQNVNFVFNSNNTYTATGLFNTVTTVTNPDGSTTTGDTVIVDMDDAGTYTLNVSNSTLIVTDSDGDVTAMEITEYTETEMTLFSEETTVANNSTIVTTLEYRFTR